MKIQLKFFASVREALGAADEAEKEILIFPGRLSILHHKPHDFITGEL